MSRHALLPLLRRPRIQIALVSFVALVALAVEGSKASSFTDLWLSPDQQGRRAFEARDWEVAEARFEAPAWRAMAAFMNGRYVQAGEQFARVPGAEGSFNRGVALMKGRDYRGAVDAFEVAVELAPAWREAQENLALARYTLAYIEDTREQSDTGDESELSADDYAFDNTEERGREMEVTRESTIGLEAAEQWMRAVDTDTADFLRSRFSLEAARSQAP